MRLLFPFFLVLLFTASLTAQDVFKQELFATELIMKYRADIGLSEAQATSIKRIYGDEIGGFNTLKWDLDAAQNELAKLLSANTVDRSTALAKMEKISALEDQLKKIRLGMLIDIKNVLSAEQQRQLKNLRTSKDMDTPFFQIAAINDNPRIVLKVNGDDELSPQPLIVLVDPEGNKSFVTSMNHLDPNEIASVNVLKGASAEALYGEDGKNGVVIIKMK